MVDLTDFLGDIPDWKKYYTVDETYAKAREVTPRSRGSRASYTIN
jgi:hypothetical protein